LWAIANANGNGNGNSNTDPNANSPPEDYTDPEACADSGPAPDSLALFRSLTLELANRFASSSKGQ